MDHIALAFCPHEKPVQFSELAGAFGLSRSTLLYYDRIGLLSASGRTASGYRRYFEKDYRRLQRICRFRDAGLAFGDIQDILLSGQKRCLNLLEKRMQETAVGIVDLKNQQRVLAGMLSRVARTSVPVDVHFWVEMLEAAGMDREGRRRWHAEFQRRAPEAHNEFLLSLGMTTEEATKIRCWSRGHTGEKSDTK